MDSELKEDIIEEMTEEPEKLKKEKKKKNSKKQDEMHNLIANMQELEEKNLRLTAEMQNMRRRQTEEISRLLKYEGEDLIKEIFPIIDNFERALNVDESNEELNKYLSGFKMIHSSLLKVLEEKGVKVIDCLGKEFDPNTMDAVFAEEKDGAESNLVIEVLQTGYAYNDKVIRPSMVKVSK